MTVQIIHGDARLLENLHADVMITDPPYSEHVHKNATSHSGKRGARHRDLGFAHLDDDLRNAIARQASNVKRWSIIYSDIEGLGEWRQACAKAGATYIRSVPWIRFSMPQLSGDRPPQGCEMVQVFWGSQKGRKSWNGAGNLTHLAHKSLRGEDKMKCEKGLDQLLDLVSWFSNPGETVIDLTAGSGTTGLACRILGRNFVGYEIDPEWAEKAAKRLSDEKLSERDEERYRRWLESQETAKADAERRKNHTAKIRAKLEAADV